MPHFSVHLVCLLPLATAHIHTPTGPLPTNSYNSLAAGYWTRISICFTSSTADIDDSLARRG